MSRLAPNRSKERGQTLVEFALILPVFVLVLVGLFDLGRGVFAFNTVSNAAREAVRVGIVDQTCQTILDEARNKGVSLGLTDGDISVWFWNPSEATPAVPGSAFTHPANGSPCGSPLPPECVPPGVGVPGVAVGCILEVKVTYHYSAATPLIGNIVGTFSISSTSREPVERNGLLP